MIRQAFQKRRTSSSIRSIELFSTLLRQICILIRQNCLYLLRRVYSFFKTSFSVRCYPTEMQLRPITTN